MTPPASLSEAAADPVVAAIGRAGITGITKKQLSEVTLLPEDRVSDRLAALHSRKAIARIGRGLWVLDRYAVVDPEEADFKGPSWYNRTFEHQFNLQIGRQAGEIQFNQNERRPVHRWWPYVQGFSAEFVAATCRRFGATRGAVVLDPFCGSGTVPVTARSLGAKGVGIDMMPVAAFVAAAKGEWEADPDELRATALRVAADRSPPTLGRPFLKETERQFTPEILQALLRLKENIWALGDGAVKTLLELGFASILIDSSNLKRAPCLGYAKKLGLSSQTPYDLFLEAIRRTRADLELLQTKRESWGPKPDIRLGSSAAIRMPQDSIDLAITSPPYVNGMDYVMNYKIDLAWLDFVRSYEQLANLRASMVACDNIPRGTAADHQPSGNVRSDAWLMAITKSIAHNIKSKGSYRRDDMGAIVTKYFDDLFPVMQNVLRALKPGGRFVIVNGDSLIAGTYVPGDLIFARLAARIGFIVEGFAVARERRSGQRRGFVLRESVLTLRKPGPYVAPRPVRAQAQALEVFGAPN
jgi:DNA modification methylase